MANANHGLSIYYSGMVQYIEHHSMEFGVVAFAELANEKPSECLLRFKQYLTA